MSVDSRENLSLSVWRKATMFAAAALLAAGVAGAGTVAAQDATPTAAAECVAPDLPPGAPTSEEEMMATPEAHDMTDMASPVAEEEAGAVETPVGTMAEGETAEEILQAANNVFACIAGGDFEGLAALMTPEFMMSTFGTDNPYDVAMFMQGTEWSEFSASNPMTYEDGSVSADVEYMSSDYQLSHERWYFVQDGEHWKINRLGFLASTTELDSTVVGVTLTETVGDDGSVTYAFEPTRPAAPEAPAIIFHLVNAGSEVHEMILVQLPEGVEPAAVLDGSVAEEDIKFVGAIAPLMPGEEADMTIIGLEPGVYTMVCFFPDAQGVPHIANGMWAQFEVTAAE
jgi:uncharacterized cupredoxin-like copper-binding protein